MKCGGILAQCTENIYRSPEAFVYLFLFHYLFNVEIKAKLNRQIAFESSYKFNCLKKKRKENDECL